MRDAAEPINGATGAFIDAFVSMGSGGVNCPTNILFVECETCAADIDNSGAVDFGDILAILSAWGPCEGECPEDLNNSGAVDFGDLLVVLGAWGPCP